MKQKFRSILVAILPLILFWFLLVPSLEPFLVMQGIFAVGLVLLFSNSWMSSSHSTQYSVLHGFICLPKYIGLLIQSIYRSAFSVTVAIIKHDTHPGIVEVPIRAKTPLVQTLIANAITLTPGTITLDIQDTTLYVLSIRDDEATKKQVIHSVQTKLEPLVLPIERREDRD